jgi:hypothetical protein
MQCPFNEYESNCYDYPESCTYCQTFIAFKYKHPGSSITIGKRSTKGDNKDE